MLERIHDLSCHVRGSCGAWLILIKQETWSTHCANPSRTVQSVGIFDDNPLFEHSIFLIASLALVSGREPSKGDQEPHLPMNDILPLTFGLWLQQGDFTTPLSYAFRCHFIAESKKWLKDPCRFETFSPSFIQSA